ncbi:MAG: arsenate reductase ArsC [Nitrospirae bacterium]|nr:arsenate reductase ArsC [Candidatus Manganitrophaceae bacterium]
MKQVLFLCTGNSCRSQMAEALLNHLGKHRYQALSAGAKPTGIVHPLTIRTLHEAGLPTEDLRSKSWDEFKNQPIDIVITVCESAKESCPIWPGPINIHWSLEDPAEAKGSDEEKMRVFRRVFSAVQQRVQSFLADVK